jgi:signal peptidase I
VYQRRIDGTAREPEGLSQSDEPGGGGEGVGRKRRRSRLRVAWEWTQSAAVAFVLLLGTRTFLVEAFKIPTSSMEGTLLVGDFLLVNKAVYGAEIPGIHLRVPALQEPGRGDVIVFNPPHDPSKNYVKRLVGMPGDTVEMRQKRLFVNGRSIMEPYALHGDGHGDVLHPSMQWQIDYLARPVRDYRATRDNWGPLVVPEAHFFVLGDNRDNSEDSRYWGFVPRESILGRPWMVYYSFENREPRRAGWISGVRWDRIGELIE